MLGLVIGGVALIGLLVVAEMARRRELRFDEMRAQARRNLAYFDRRHPRP